MTADQLQAALNEVEGNDLRYDFELTMVIAAARSWLSFLEADETIIGQIETIIELDALNADRTFRETAVSILAAIVGEEQ